jgi:hypothetical protein
VDITSDDALTPPDYMFTADDAGEHEFTAAFQTSGIHWLQAMDTAMEMWVGRQDGIVVI